MYISVSGVWCCEIASIALHEFLLLLLPDLLFVAIEKLNAYLFTAVGRQLKTHLFIKISKTLIRFFLMSLHEREHVPTMTGNDSNAFSFDTGQNAGITDMTISLEKHMEFPTLFSFLKMSFKQVQS